MWLRVSTYSRKIHPQRAGFPGSQLQVNNEEFRVPHSTSITIFTRTLKQTNEEILFSAIEKTRTLQAPKSNSCVRSMDFLRTFTRVFGNPLVSHKGTWTSNKISSCKRLLQVPFGQHFLFIRGFSISERFSSERRSTLAK